MAHDLSSARPELLHYTKTDPDPRVRHRAHLLLVVLDSPTQSAAAQATKTDPKYLRKWRDRYGAHGRAGLVDRPRSGRPPVLGPDACTLITAALASSPMDYGYPVATWSVVDLHDLLTRRGWPISRASVYRQVHALGYVYRRPRHDLHHRQNAEAVASAQHTLRILQKRGLIPTEASACSISTSATSIPIPTWHRSGNDADSPRSSLPPGSTNGSRCSGHSSIAPGT